jgi:isoleucyl-tRNA synthetase
LQGGWSEGNAFPFIIFRRSRRRFWKSDNDSDKNNAYATLYKALVDFSKILAPFLPFLAEEIYQILVREANPNAPVSVHLTSYPEHNAEYANEKLVRRMSLVRSAIEKGRAIRSANEIKNRQPLKTLTLVPHNDEAKQVAETMQDLILEELNVEQLHFANDDTELAKISAKPNFAGIKAKGTDYAKNMKTLSTAITALTAEQIKQIQSGTPLDVAGLPIDYSCLMLVREVAEGLAVEADENYTIALDLKITPELRQSCIARELVNRIQNRRKEMDLQITDKIKIALKGLGTYADLQAAVEKHRGYILEETQGLEIGFGSAQPTGGVFVSVNVEGYEIEISISTNLAQ